MLLFGINFNLYYFLLVRRFRDVFRSEELWAYLIRLFRDSGPYAKRLRKARDPQTFSQAVDAVFQELELLPEADWGD